MAKLLAARAKSFPYLGKSSDWKLHSRSNEVIFRITFPYLGKSSDWKHFPGGRTVSEDHPSHTLGNHLIGNWKCFRGILPSSPFPYLGKSSDWKQERTKTGTGAPDSFPYLGKSSDWKPSRTGNLRDPVGSFPYLGKSSDWKRKDSIVWRYFHPPSHTLGNHLIGNSLLTGYVFDIGTFPYLGKSSDWKLIIRKFPFERRVFLPIPWEII